MRTKPAGSVLIMTMAWALSACQTLGVGGAPTAGVPIGEQTAATRSEPQNIRFGTLTAIEWVDLEGDHQLGLGAVVGAAAGGLLGHQIGKGSGQDVATVLGAIGGAVAGDVVQRKYLQKKTGQRLTVALDNGVTVVVTQETDAALRVGDKVRIEGAGQAARVRLR